MCLFLLSPCLGQSTEQGKLIAQIMGLIFTFQLVEIGLSVYLSTSLSLCLSLHISFSVPPVSAFYPTLKLEDFPYQYMRVPSWCFRAA